MREVCRRLVVCAVAFGKGPSVAVSPPPAGYKPKTDVALSPTATEAVRVSEGFRAESNPPSPGPDGRDRKSTRLNSSHVRISYAVFCLKKKKKNIHQR